MRTFRVTVEVFVPDYDTKKLSDINFDEYVEFNMGLHDLCEEVGATANCGGIECKDCVFNTKDKTIQYVKAH
jgi:hypothetical protein